MLGVVACTGVWTLAFLGDEIHKSETANSSIMKLLYHIPGVWMVRKHQDSMLKQVCSVSAITRCLAARWWVSSEGGFSWGFAFFKVTPARTYCVVLKVWQVTRRHLEGPVWFVFVTDLWSYCIPSLVCFYCLNWEQRWFLWTSSQMFCCFFNESLLCSLLLFFPDVVLSFMSKPQRTLL